MSWWQARLGLALGPEQLGLRPGDIRHPGGHIERDTSLTTYNTCPKYSL